MNTERNGRRQENRSGYVHIQAISKRNKILREHGLWTHKLQPNNVGNETELDNTWVFFSGPESSPVTGVDRKSSRKMENCVQTWGRFGPKWRVASTFWLAAQEQRSGGTCRRSCTSESAPLPRITCYRNKRQGKWFLKVLAPPSALCALILLKAAT